MPFVLLSPLYCASRIYIMHQPNLPIGRNTCSAIKSSFLVSVRQLPKDSIPPDPLRCHMVLTSGLCKLSIIYHWMHSPVSQKLYITALWLLTGGIVLGAFWLLFLGFNPQIWLEQIFHFFPKWTIDNFSSTRDSSRRRISCKTTEIYYFSVLKSRSLNPRC